MLKVKEALLKSRKFEFPLKGDVIAPKVFRTVIYGMLAVVIFIAIITILVDKHQNSFIARSYATDKHHDKILDQHFIVQAKMEARIKKLEMDNDALKDLLRNIMEMPVFKKKK